MSSKGRMGAILFLLGMIMLFLPFTRELAFVSVLMVAFGSVTFFRDVIPKGRLRGLLGSVRRPSDPPAREASLRIDPLLPVRILKLAESREGSLTVSVVAIALNVGLDECQTALDDLVHKGAASVDIDLATGVANYKFPEFLPHRLESAESI